VKHRHLDYDDVPVDQLGPAALDDLLERGDFTDWRPLARAIAADPFGALAERVLHLCDAHPVQGTSPLWRAWIAARRARASGRADRAPQARLRELREARQVTQAQLAEVVGISQSDLSKAERRADLRLSTLGSLVEGLGYELRLLAVDPATGAAREIVIGEGAATPRLNADRSTRRPPR
jgi:DNA-binding Xre family transcriptional regulator